MGYPVYEQGAAWCDRARAMLVETTEALNSFRQRRETILGALDGQIAEIRSGTETTGRLLRTGAAGALCEMERKLLASLAGQSVPLLGAVQSRAAALGATTGKEPVPASLDAAERELKTAAAQLSDLRDRMNVSEAEAGQHAGRNLPELLKSLAALPSPAAKERTERPPLFVPKEKRSARVKTALWALGIFGVIALIAKGFSFVFWLGLAALFIAQAAVTNIFETEEENRRVNAATEAKHAVKEFSDQDQKLRTLLGGVVLLARCELDEFAKVVAAKASEAIEVARARPPVSPPASHLVLGQGLAPLHLTWLAKHPKEVNFSMLASGSTPVDRLEGELQDSIAHAVMTECDGLDVILGEEADSARVSQDLLVAVLKAAPPGAAQFMFIEPGRLAESYRVFGALNDSPATRLGERLYLTQANEIGDGVDALRAFVGRMKEAATRREVVRGGATGSEQEGGGATQRAIVVLDATEDRFWPERDRRRLQEYWKEVQSLAQVGAREGSVLLILLRRASESNSTNWLLTGPRAIRLAAESFGYLLAPGEAVRHNPQPSRAELAQACDAWAEKARKSRSDLKQQHASLNWADSARADSRYGLEVEIGRHSSGKPARLVLGKDGAHHAICIGRTGSGKTNLFHVIISNLARRYSPDELELYLLDFKEGVEFAAYANVALPHCRALAMDADRGFGLSVLQHLRRELARRANVFKAAGVDVTNLETYEETTGKNMPRILLMIDEFQVLLQGGERTAGVASGAAASALEDLVRRGRSFGLHVILGSQTLAGRELTPATLGQLALRIVLPSSAADAATLLGEQSISSQLRAPGDAIIWTAGQGEVSEGNLAKVFSRDLSNLAEIAEASREHMRSRGEVPPAPVVFRGGGQSALAEVMPHLTARCAETREGEGACFAIGAPTAFGERPAGVLRRRRSRNVLFVHRADETRTAFLYSALESLLTLQAQTSALVCDLDGAEALTGNSVAGVLKERFDGRVRLLKLDELEEAARLNVEAPPAGASEHTVIALAGAGRTTLARSSVFGRLLKEGPELGVHVLATCDSPRNLERFIERSWLGEFGMRGIGPASATDSQRVIESNDAETLTADYQYLFLDDEHSNKISRLQATVSSCEEG